MAAPGYPWIARGRPAEGSLGGESAIVVYAGNAGNVRKWYCNAMKHKFWCKAVSVVSPGPCDCWFNDPDDNDRRPRRPKPKPLPPSAGAPPSPVKLFGVLSNHFLVFPAFPAVDPALNHELLFGANVLSKRANVGGHLMPSGNSVGDAGMLFAGVVLASVGTTGAAMIVVRPLIRANLSIHPARAIA